MKGYLACFRRTFYVRQLEKWTSKNPDAIEGNIKTPRDAIIIIPLRPGLRLWNSRDPWITFFMVALYVVFRFLMAYSFDNFTSRPPSRSHQGTPRKPASTRGLVEDQMAVRARGSLDQSGDPGFDECAP